MLLIRQEVKSAKYSGRHLPELLTLMCIGEQVSLDWDVSMISISSLLCDDDGEYEMAFEATYAVEISLKPTFEFVKGNRLDVIS